MIPDEVYLLAARAQILAGPVWPHDPEVLARSVVQLAKDPVLRAIVETTWAAAYVEAQAEMIQSANAAMEARSWDLVSIEATEPLFGEHIGQVALRTHPEGACSGEYCCIHNPSDHHMREWPQLWRSDKGLMERTCPHGVGHPDPDDIAHKRRVNAPNLESVTVHGCCGCCTLSTDAVESPDGQKEE